MRAVSAVTLALALAGAACSGDPERDAAGTLALYFQAVRSGDAAAIAPLLEDCLGAPGEGRDGCADRIGAELASVEAQRELDAYRFDEAWGFGLVQALVLGGGGWWRLEEVRDLPASQGVRRYEAQILVRTQYRAGETAALPEGAVIEYLVAPLGEVKRLGRGAKGPGALREQLVERRLRARLTRRADGWRVVSLEALPESAVFETVTWRPS